MFLVPRPCRANFCEEKILFVGGVVRADDAELAALAFLTSANLPADDLERLRPGNRLEAVARRAASGDCRRSGCSDEIESVAALDAQELAVDAAAVAIVAANDLVVAHAQRGAAAIGAMRADGADVVHLPGPRLITVNSAGERAHGANIDAGAALVAFQMIVMIGNDFGDHAAIGDAQRVHAHAFIADAHAAVAQNAARRVEEHHRRPLLFVDV